VQMQGMLSKGPRVINTPIFQVDAFTSTPFSGNPAVVCLLSAPAGPTGMQTGAWNKKEENRTWN